jgi:hypothetical protein
VKSKKRVNDVSEEIGGVEFGICFCGIFSGTTKGNG